MRREHTDGAVTCREFARAMLRAGQDHFEVLERLHGMNRWTRLTVKSAVGRAEGDLGKKARKTGPGAKNRWLRRQASAELHAN